MRKDPRKREIAMSLKLLATTYVRAIRQLEETLVVLSDELELNETLFSSQQVQYASTLERFTSPPSPLADRNTLSVVHAGKRCFLGNTLLFRFFEAIARRPNRFVSHEELLDEVWGGPRSSATIRNVAKRLRDKLKSAGLAGLAGDIDGSTPGHYILVQN